MQESPNNGTDLEDGALQRPVFYNNVNPSSMIEPDGAESGFQRVETEDTEVQDQDDGFGAELERMLVDVEAEQLNFAESNAQDELSLDLERMVREEPMLESPNGENGAPNNELRTVWN